MLILGFGILLSLTCFLFRRDKIVLILGFVIILLIMGFQNNGHNDYLSYNNEFTLMSETGRVETLTIEKEPLWGGIMFFFSCFTSFGAFIFSLALFETCILFSFIKRYIPKDYAWLSIILFYFTFNMMLLQMYVIRQALAVDLVLLAFLLYDRRASIFLSLMCLLCAFLIHNSSIVVLPFLLMLYLSRNKKNGSYNEKRWAVNLPFFIFILFVVLYIIRIKFLSQYLAPVMLLTDYGSYFDEDKAFGISNTFEISPLIALYNAIVIFVVAWYFRFANRRMRFFCIMTISAAFSDMLFWGLGSISRIVMYFSIFSLPVYSSIIPVLKAKYGSFCSVIFVILLIGYALKTSLPWITGVDDNQFGNYKFIFMP